MIQLQMFNSDSSAETTADNSTQDGAALSVRRHNSNTMLPAATGTETALDKWKKEHPFKFHILRLDNGNLMHVNSIFTNANDGHYPECDYEDRMRKYTVCNNIEKLKETIERPQLVGVQKQYVITNLDWKLLNTLYAIHT